MSFVASVLVKDGRLGTSGGSVDSVVVAVVDVTSFVGGGETAFSIGVSSVASRFGVEPLSSSE